MPRRPSRRRARGRSQASEPSAASAADALGGYLADLIHRKRGTREADLLGDLVAAARVPAAESPLTSQELLGMAFLLLVAGHETTVNLISATVHALLTHPDQLELLRTEPELVDAAVEEPLRHSAPVHATAFRFAAEPIDLAGTRIPAGDAVQISLAAASRDPLHHPDPDRFDLRRRGPGHLAFGHGLHHRLGAPLAHTEAAVAAHLLLRHRPDLTLATDPTTLRWRTGTLVRGVSALPCCAKSTGRAVSCRRPGSAGRVRSDVSPVRIHSIQVVGTAGSAPGPQPRTSASGVSSTTRSA